MKRFLAIIVLSLPLFGESVTESRKLQQEARAAYQAKDHATFLAKIKAASDLRPQHAGLLYSLAKAQALNGQFEEAALTLARVAGMGMTAKPLEDPDLQVMRGYFGIGRIVDRFTFNASPIGEASTAFTLNERGLIPEGLARDPKTGTFYVASVRDGVIRAIDSKGATREFARLPMGAFGMTLDNKRNSLWVASSAVPQNRNFREEDRNHPVVVRIDLKSGKIVQTIKAPAAGKHLFGDVALAPNGDLYVSDTDAPAVYRVRSGKLETVIEGEPFVSLQGISVSNDGRTIYVADYSKGLYAIDTKTLDPVALTVPPNVSLLGVDGLYVQDKDTLLATQNGTNPHRIIRIELDGTKVSEVAPLVVNHEAFDEPTLGVPSGDLFYFVANSQWNLYGEDGKPADEAKLKPVVVLKTKVGS